MRFPLGTRYRPLGVFGAALLAWVSVASWGLLAADIPIGVTGFTADVVTVASPNPVPVTAFDGGTAAWFESGLQGHTDGLPVGGSFVNNGSNNTTNTGTTFQLQSYTGNNVLLLGGTNSLTLNLLTPQSYGSLAILASSGSGGGVGTAVLNFSDGSHATISYNAQDWNQNGTPAGPAAIGNLGRNTNVGATGTAFTYGKNVPFAMYETDFDLGNMGDATKLLESITFNGVAGSAAHTGIFALSGAVPEPCTLVLCGVGTLGLLGFSWRRKAGR
jgi:hypothetical protein